MNLKRIRRYVEYKLNLCSLVHNTTVREKQCLELQKSHHLPSYKLTKQDKQAANNVWHGVISKKGFTTYRLIATATGAFDPYVCSKLVLNKYILPYINAQDMISAFSDKNYLDLFLPNEGTPKTILRNINGSYLDSNYQPIDATMVNALLEPYDSVIVKPSINSGGGRSVKRYNKEDYAHIPKTFGKNYIIQEPLVQHASLAALNPSSVNIVRIVSLSLNGVVSPVNCSARFGEAGGITDNTVTKTGRGMCVVGLNPDGTLKERGYYLCGAYTTTGTTGIPLNQIQIPHYDTVLEMTTRIHKQLPHFGLIGFDICFNEEGTPLIMEINLKVPGMICYQYANGPLFGDRTQEVIDTFCKKK